MYCGYCRRAGRTQRLAIQRTVNRHGYEYLYFFCRNKRDGLCRGSHIHMYQVEEAVERHYASIRFRPEFISDVGAHVDTVISEQEASTRLLHKQISAQLRELEENLIDLAADDTLPQTKVKARLRDIERERRHLTQRLDTASADLTDSARLIRAALTLLEAPEELYRRCNGQQRRLLNQAIFHGLFVEDDQVTDHDLRPPSGSFSHSNASTSPRPRARRSPGHHMGAAKRPPVQRVALQPPVSPSCSRTFTRARVLIATPKVELRGLEPLTPSLPVRCATSCAIAPGAEAISASRGRYGTASLRARGHGGPNAGVSGPSGGWPGRRCPGRSRRRRPPGEWPRQPRQAHQPR